MDRTYVPRLSDAHQLDLELTFTLPLALPLDDNGMDTISVVFWLGASVTGNPGAMSEKPLPLEVAA